MGKKDEALVLAKQLRNSLFNNDKDVSNLLLGCKTVCRYLEILDENKWIDYELNGYDHLYGMNIEEVKKNIPKYRIASFTFYGADNRPIIMDNERSQILFNQPVFVGSVELENIGELTITSATWIDLFNDINSKYYITRYPVIKAILSSNSINKIMYGIRNRINELLDEIILELEFGEIPEQIFEVLRNDVDSEMIKICPNAINKLIVVYENLKHENPESYSHIASSCRRIIKDVADVIFPPKKEPFVSSGREVKVDENSFINRIQIGLEEKIESETINDFNKDMFNYVINFLRSIQKYASKGNHSNFTKLDATRCVIYTYLVLGDILHYYKIK